MPQPRRSKAPARVVGLAAALVCLVLVACAPRAPEPPVRAVGRQVVALVPDRAAAARLAAAAATGGYVARGRSALPALGLEMLTYERPEGVTGAEAIDALEAAVPGSTVGFNHVYQLQQAAPGAGRLDYASALLGWPAGGCRALAPAGLIDTGVDVGAAAMPGTRVITRRFAPGPAGPTQHGTEVARVLADPARLDRALIYNADVVRGEGDISDAATMIRALDWLTGEGVRVVNLSLAGPYNQLLDLAVSAAAGRGVILVAAAGNAGPAAAPQYPAGFDPVIAVTAVDAARRLYPGAVQGPHIDVAAPGVDVFVPLGGRGRFVTGTSIAAPFVTARILADADLLAAGTVADLRKALMSGAEDLGPRGADPAFGAGLLRADGLCPGSG